MHPGKNIIGGIAGKVVDGSNTTVQGVNDSGSQTPIFSQKNGTLSARLVPSIREAGKIRIYLKIK